MSYLDEAYGLGGRTALVTGSRSGIGRAAALALAGAGADVILWGRSEDGLAPVADEVRRLGVDARVVAADLADLEAVAAAATRVASMADVDILVNNAGMIARGPARELSVESWREVHTVNLDAMFVLCQAVGGPMTDRGSGAVINVASLLSFQGGVRVAPYAASKHAVAGLTKALANEWAPRGVNVNAVAPGYVATEVTRPLREDGARYAEISARIPAGRWAEPDDIGAAIAFLASPAAAYIHGHVLVVDGGWMSR